MRVAGVVAEFNPFHNGHKLLIDRAREALGPDSAVVCAMSGDFVQRGEAAVWSKFARAEAAARREALRARYESSREGYVQQVFDIVTGKRDE